MNRRHGRVPGDALLANGAPEREGMEARGNYDRATRKQRGERGCDQAVYVEQRHEAKRDVLGRELIGVDDVARGENQVDVLERNAFGPAGGAAGVKDEGDVVWRGRAGGAGRR